MHEHVDGIMDMCAHLSMALLEALSEGASARCQKGSNSLSLARSIASLDRVRPASRGVVAKKPPKAPSLVFSKRSSKQMPVCGARSGVWSHCADELQYDQHDYYDFAPHPPVGGGISTTSPCQG